MNIQRNLKPTFSSPSNHYITIFNPPPNAKRIKVKIPYSMIEERRSFKALNGTFYHPHQRTWSITNTPQNMASIKQMFVGKFQVEAPVIKKKIPEIKLNERAQDALLQNQKILILKGLSPNTIRVYQSCLKHFFGFFQGGNLDELRREEIEDYMFMLVDKYNIGEQTQNQIINAVKSYYEHTLGKERVLYKLSRPKKHLRLPGVLSENEVLRIINAPANLKHKAILYTIYSGGLRISEVLNLRIADIHSEEGNIFIKAAKGKKDRNTVLSPILLDVLRAYYRKEKPSYWLFEGATGGKYSASSIQAIFRRSVQKVGGNAWATPHTLRHSFATHLMQAGTNLRYIQSALGHSSSKTTEIYTHVLRINNKTIESPLDIMLKKLNSGEKA